MTEKLIYIDMRSTFGDINFFLNVNKLKFQQKMVKKLPILFTFLFFHTFYVPSKFVKMEFSHFKGIRTCSFPNFRASQQLKYIDMRQRVFNLFLFALATQN